MRHWIIWGILAGAIISFLLIYFLFDPSACVIFPKCPFLSLTGLKCPGCGSQRAIHSLLSGNIVQAWHFNALLVAFLPVVAVYGLGEALRTRKPVFYQRINSPAVIWSIFVIVVAWWILRNIFNW